MRAVSVLTDYVMLSLHSAPLLYRPYAFNAPLEGYSLLKSKSCVSFELHLKYLKKRRPHDTGANINGSQLKERSRT